MKYEFHELANIFPLMNERDVAELAEDIARNGQREPIYLYDGKILDGRNRYNACARAGVTPRYEHYDGDAPLEFVVSLNLHRRHLDESQRAMAAAKIAKLTNKDNQHTMRTSIDVPTTQSDAASMMNVGIASVQRARKVLNEGADELIEAVEQGGIAVSRAAHIATMPKEEQIEVVRKAHVSYNSGNNEWYTPAEYADAARAVMDGIDTDPASTEAANEAIRAACYYTEDEDGLSLPWHGRVWMNPPYSQPHIEHFCEKLVSEYDAGNITQAVVLVNNATETKWFQGVASRASAICFPRGRIRFWSPSKESATPLQGQALLYYGDNVQKFGDEFGGYGLIFATADE